MRKMTKYLKVHFSSASMNWKTPKKLFEELDKEFDFNFDPCPEYASFDGLAIDWKERNFVNPPYGNQLKLWIKKREIPEKL